MKDEINLLKPDQASNNKWFGFGNKFPLFLYVIAALLLGEILFWGWLFFSTRSVSREIESMNRSIAEADLEINKNQPELKIAVGYQARLDSLDGLLEGHMYWSPVFEELGKYTLKELRYSTFVGDADDHSITVAGTASSYAKIAKLILGLKQSSKFKEVLFRSEGASSGATTGYSFILEITPDSALFKKQ